MERVAIILTNYNMPERCDALCEHIVKHVHYPHDLIVVDNGSDLIAPSRFTTLCLEENRQTTGGWLAGLEYADTLAAERGRPFYAYWFLITSAEFPANLNGLYPDPLNILIEPLLDNPDVVGVHPALTEDSTTAWGHLKTRGKHGLRRTWMIDNIAALYRAEWLDSIGRFDPELVYAWGVDLETCWKARKQGKKLFVHEDILVKKVTNIGYEMGRMNMTAAERKQKAGQQMHDVLCRRYGRDWDWHMRQEFVTNEMV